MTTPRYFDVYLTDTTKDEYDRMRADKRFVMHERTGLCYVHSVGQIRTMYVHDNGHYYKGQLAMWQRNDGWVGMEYLGITKKVVFKQPDKKVLADEPPKHEPVLPKHGPTLEQIKAGEHKGGKAA